MTSPSGFMRIICSPPMVGGILVTVISQPFLDFWIVTLHFHLSTENPPEFTCAIPRLNACCKLVTIAGFGTAAPTVADGVTELDAEQAGRRGAQPDTTHTVEMATRTKARLLNAFFRSGKL